MPSWFLQQHFDATGSTDGLLHPLCQDFVGLLVAFPWICLHIFLTTLCRLRVKHVGDARQRIEPSSPRCPKGDAVGGAAFGLRALTRLSRPPQAIRDVCSTASHLSVSDRCETSITRPGCHAFDETCAQQGKSRMENEKNRKAQKKRST